MTFQKGHKLSPGRTEGSKNKKTLARLGRFEEELDEIMKAMALKDKDTEDYRTLVDAADKINKQIQLLSGEPTERNDIMGVEISVRK